MTGSDNRSRNPAHAIRSSHRVHTGSSVCSVVPPGEDNQRARGNPADEQGGRKQPPPGLRSTTDLGEECDNGTLTIEPKATAQFSSKRMYDGWEELEELEGTPCDSTTGHWRVIVSSDQMVSAVSFTRAVDN